MSRATVDFLITMAFAAMVIMGPTIALLFVAPR